MIVGLSPAAAFARNREAARGLRQVRFWPIASFGCEGHFDPLHLAGETLAGGVLGYGLRKTVPGINNAVFQQPAQQRAIDAARSTLSTGRLQKPILPDAPFRDAIRALIFGQGAGGPIARSVNRATKCLCYTLALGRFLLSARRGLSRAASKKHPDKDAEGEN